MQAARTAGVSKTTIRRAQEDGEFTPHAGESGEHLLDEAELRRWLLRRQKRERVRRGGGAVPEAGAIAALAFDRFDHDESPVDVVKAQQLDPDHVERLHDQWVRLRGRLVLSSETVETLVRDLARAFGVPVATVRSVEGLRQWTTSVVQRAEQLYATAHRPCARCKRAGSAPTTCTECVEDARLKQRIRIEEIRASVREHEANLQSYDLTPVRKRAKPRLPSELPGAADERRGPGEVGATVLRAASDAGSPKATRLQVPANWFEGIEGAEKKRER